MDHDRTPLELRTIDDAPGNAGERLATVEAFRAPGLTDEHVLEIILAIAVKTISNWTNHVFGTEVDEVFAGHTWTVPHRA